MRKEVFLGGRITLVHCDMFDPEGLASVPEGSVRSVITDLPYGTLNARNGWDKVVDLERLWAEVHRVVGKSWSFVSTAQMPFTACLVSSNLKEFKYSLVWEKSKATGYLNAKKQPLRAHEDICVFYGNQCVYNPVMTKGSPYNKGTAVRDTGAYGVQTKAVEVRNDDGSRYPRSVLYFVTAESEGGLHPTQKPVALYEWLVNTYTGEDDIVLDPCFGSGTTAMACVRSGRKFVGFERDAGYFEAAVRRISDETSGMLFY